MKKSILIITAVILTLILLSSCSMIAYETISEVTTAEPQPPQMVEVATEDVSFQIMFTNDIHGRINNDSENPSYGYARIAQMKEDLAANGEVLLFSAGDVLQGTPYVNESNGESAFNLMNLASYDAMTPGNHDFDWGGDNLLALAQMAEFDILSANILYEADGSPVFDENKIYSLENGMNIGVFGLTTPSTKTTTSPSAVADFKFLADEELYTATQQQIDSLIEQGANFIVCLSHLGIDDTSVGSRSYDVIDNVSGIDLFIDAHSHVEMNEMQGNTLLVSTGAFGENVGVATYLNGELSAELIPAVIQEENTAEYAGEVTEEVDDALSAPVATTEVFLDGEYETVRVSETNLGDLSTDAILWYANTHMGIEADVSIMNSGSIRASINEGDITLLDVKNVFPYGNTLVSLNITGAQLLETIEAASAELPEHTAPFAQVSGIEYTVNTAIPYESGDNYPDSTFAPPLNPGARVSITSVGGEEFSLTEIYTIVTIDFLAMGGDSYYALTQAEEGSVIDSGTLMEDAFAAYIDEELGGTVGESYAQAAGRIVIEQ